ncbi:serine hydrolase domain-containing protein [Lapillicoccus sp.]|uniref:serine hydrolase domain-containing protein n=1 Tax=Lapillicoccus sp. TaxID=1909287 RepID=UPI0025CD094F|nr:serine hydrolase domain-containing protein [Lapillicoccus sp.]
MTALLDLLQPHVDSGAVPGAVALLTHDADADAGARVEVEVVGSQDAEGTTPMTRDSIFRIASITKPITAATVMMLVEDGLLGLDDPVDTWLPELTSPMMLRTPDGPLDDLVPAARAITVRDLLESRAGWGFPDAFDWPAVQALLAVQPVGREVAAYPAHVWLEKLAKVPLVHQPRECWLHNTCSDLQGVLVARVTGQSLPQVFAERVFEPLGMVDTGFVVPTAAVTRLTSSYRATDVGLELVDGPDGQWARTPEFPSGAGGLVSTADDYLAFNRMLAGRGEVDGIRLLSSDAVRLMTTDHLTPAQRAASRLFLDGQGWGYGGCVDVDPIDPWVVPGRYGWVGDTGTSAHLVPATGDIAILLTQRATDSPVPSSLMAEFWTSAAGA